MNFPSLKLSNLNVVDQARLSEYTTFKLGGPCKGLISCQTPQELEFAISELKKCECEFILMGGGSNLVVSDDGVDCYVIRYVSDEPIIKQDENNLTVSGGTNLDALANYCAHEGLEGLSCCTGIPGTVGGAVVGNAGAFGKQIGDVTDYVTLLSKSGKKEIVHRDKLAFAYRHSSLKKGDDIVMDVHLALDSGDKIKLLNERQEILDSRREKHPDLLKEPCAGSFFRNIEPSSKAGRRQAAGWFLDQAGGKNLRRGGAYVFHKHANIIIKSKGCTSENVYELSEAMHQLVKEKFNLDLIREVCFVGKFDRMPNNVQSRIW